MRTRSLDPLISDSSAAPSSSRHHIGARLTKYALGAAVLLGVVLSLVRIGLDLVNEKERIERTILQILDTVEPSASRAAFQLNQRVGEEILSGLFAYEFIRRAEIEDEDGRQLAVVDRPPQNGFLDGFSKWLFADTGTYSVVLRTDDRAHVIGRLTLDLDTYVVALGVLQRAIVILVVGIIWSVIFAIMLSYIFHVSLTKPLQSLVDRFRAVDPNSPEAQQFPVPVGHEGNELGTLVETINDYFARLGAMHRLLGAKEESFRGLFDETEVPMWNVDFSSAAETLTRLRRSGVSDLGDYLLAHGAVARELVSGVRIDRVNKAALSLFEAETADALIRKFDRIFPSGSDDLLVNSLCAIWDGKKVFRAETTLQTLDGNEINAIVSFRIPEARDGFASIPVSIIDITKMKKTERELHENLHRLEMTLTANNAGSWTWDKRTNRTIWSEENYRLMGYRPGEVEPTYEAWFSRVHPEDQAFAQERVDTAVAEQSRLDFEYRAVMPDGTIRWIQDIGSVIQDDDGTVLGMYGVQIDNTNRKNLEAQLVQSQKMEAVGHLTGGIAHDFNNLLQIIQGNIDLALESVIADDETKGYLHKALKATQQGAGLTHQLLAFSRKQTLSPEIVNPNEIIGGMLEILRRTLGKNIEIEAFFEDGLPQVNIDSNNFQNAILNISINAKAAMARGGTLSITTRKKRLAKALAIEGGQLPAGDYVEIRMTDNGCGMSRKTLDHAFEPFYTTKEVGKGTGLGLSMVYGFVRQSGGTVTLTSKIDKGTTVSLLFPVAKAGAARDRKRQSPDGTERGQGKILVVEDDPEVRSTVMGLLISGGYDAQEAKDAAEALEILASDGSIDVLFSDVMMPKGMSGPELAEEALRINENLKVLLTSGYPDIKPGKSGLANAGLELLRKPYSNETLFKRLNALMARHSPAGSGK